MNRILVVEDEDIIRSALQKLLTHNQYEVDCAGSVDEALSNFNVTEYDLVITDLRLPGRPGTELIDAASPAPVLIMTSYASLRSAVDSMKMGAVDYIAKPFDHDEMLAAIASILNRKQSVRTEATTEETPTASGQPLEIKDLIYGECEAMEKVFHLIGKVAPTDTTVLIQGESGTGKELAARALHQFSVRNGKPLICVNCAAIPETLIESELFGHEKGAFTGAVNARNGLVEAADGGTLFLDEIGELPLEAQARLLRVLQEGEIRRVGSTQSKQVNVRLIAATHRNLRALSKTGEFREDLYYRLNVMQIRLPALRERGDDRLGLAKRLLDKICEKVGRSRAQLSPEAMLAIQSHNWPGNVRELENAIERAVILCDGDVIDAPLLDLETDTEVHKLSTGLAASSNESHDEKPQDLSLEDYFQHFVLENQDKMSETELAQKLGISRKSLWERRQRLGIPRKKANK
ncbi:response regulator receiver-modulated signal transduction sigma54-specific transcriptional regulator [Oleiphilus messinensis]|uniref:Response regulator receiver-modulated signal transduction sigma54-specific transcriptional regulator n=1 Tax=Oleiphilus messinensis TaxID=141451 RepID=A0A1Y0IFL1_9GAMM|nr:sigma-54 dependent transcriptional regulator [Oleiphilus messinensis]ARU58596.1 response regulator receiver-modulated signal transduction sigma54-specific transcriptional regulator [Oleiphilus messinensis]